MNARKQPDFGKSVPNLVRNWHERTKRRAEVSDNENVRFTYQVVTEYATFAPSADDADADFRNAFEHGLYADNMKIIRQIITRTEELKDRGEKTWVWNDTLQRWDLTRYSLS
ncbi:MAG: hypothetical protein EBS38_05585 [Actinobacteria bacterium]|nr:hypothetical protein [Actinomycetota bacterium]